MAKIVINRTQKTAQYYLEDLGNEITLDMVLIPGGSFMMGSPEDELERTENESPQHSVTIQNFCMGKYPVTQAQWRAVAALPQINKELEADPSNLKGEQRPVEQVSWYDAVEFCDRLSQHTKRQYRLPSEAEWEYACRAGTTTPFHFGEAITSELVNCNARSSFDDTEGLFDDMQGNFDDGSKGIYREETTVVGSFKVANAFGLYDMHGNVWEWCLDDWHDNYEGAPTDGSAWIDNNDNEYRLQRGGSWVTNPVNCRSAFRTKINPNSRMNIFGFRIVCNGETATSQTVTEPENGGKYRQLRDFLASGKWKEADQETYGLMKEFLENNLTGETFFNLPCPLLREIDKLWVNYSNRRFGFSIQKEIYLNNGGKADSQYDEEAWGKFADSVGWRVNRKSISYQEINFSNSALRGHLPVRELWFDTRVPVPDEFFGERFCSLVWKVNTCKI
ncbi:MAG: SUMF1/EgtB/PvdO family nonheme iron enzyme [Nostoc sp. EkiNYC01]|nr:SUMF1/EgtB/PvdO family nonheme iron enzyme [Nostoc sp. EkiNYC01]